VLAETAIMLALHHLLPEETTPLWLHITADCTALVLVCVPLLWHFFLRPLQRAAESDSVQARAIMESAADGIVAIDEDGRVRAFNRAAETIFGYQSEEVVGNNVSMLMPAPHRSQHDAYLQRYLQSGHSKIIGRRTELQGMRQDGSLFPLELAVSENRVHGRRVFTAIVRDLTAQKQAAAEIERANTLLEKIFSNMQGLIAYLDADFNFIRVNEAYAAADGKAPEFFPGKNHFDLYPSEENETIFRRVLRTGDPYVTRARPFNYPDHPERGITWWDWTLQPIKNGGGKVESLLLTLVDVTQQMRTQEALREKEKNDRALLDATAESAFLLAADGTILMANQTGAARFGQTREAMLGANVYTFMPPEVAARRRALVEAILRDGVPTTFEDLREGREYRTTIYPILDEQGQGSRVALYAADITETKRLQGVEKLLHAVDDQIRQGAPLTEIITFICDQVATQFDLRLAWIGQKMADGSVALLAGGGPAVAYQDELLRTGVRWDDSPTGRGSTGSAIRLGKPQVIDPCTSACAPWCDAARQNEIASVCGIPLVIRGEIFGAITLYSSRSTDFRDAGLVHALENIAARISVALEASQDHDQLRLLGTALATASNAVFITNRTGTIQWVNEAFQRLSGYTANELIGNTPRLLKSGTHDQTYYEGLWRTIMSGQSFRSETTERRKDGRLYTVHQTITPVRGQDGHISHFISMQEDITEQRAAQARIEHLAHFDALTGLPNRSLFFDRLSQATAMSKRTNEHVALLFLDLDRFKPVNDTYGHAVGDALLKAVAERVLSCVRESDTVARIAGDEFTVILPRIDSRADATVVAEKIVKAVAEPFHLSGRTVTIGASIGVALCPDDARDGQELVKLADAAMYDAKHHGRNTYRFYSPA
jgi:diguanylate cyclase (GGDEF)-like protein/PAS domain S-box-containing protein